MSVTRTAWLDWFHDPTDASGGESAVFVGGEVVVVSELASVLLDAVDPDGRPTPLDDLTAALTAAFGAPPDGDAAGATLAVVHRLVASGVLTLDETA